eukprot:scaffold138951_cov55-Attheya_sp.AAC.2
MSNSFHQYDTVQGKQRFYPQYVCDTIEDLEDLGGYPEFGVRICGEFDGTKSMVIVFVLWYGVGWHLCLEWMTMNLSWSLVVEYVKSDIPV